MESTNYLQNGVKELTNEDLLIVNGGGFAYDLGFFLREIAIDLINGGGTPGYIAVSVDFSLNYKALN